MTRMTFTTKIQADKSKIWDVLWGDSTYPQWTSAFFEGSHAECEDWSEGNIVFFLSPDKNGMFSRIDKCIPNEVMTFKHLGMVKDGEKQPVNEEESWYGNLESYYLTQEDDGVLLKAELDTEESYVESMNKSFGKAFEIVKKLSEA